MEDSGGEALPDESTADALLRSIGRRAQEFGLTPEDFAEALGITASDAAELIKGQKVPADQASLRKLATLLNLPLSQLADPNSGGPLAGGGSMLLRMSADEIELISIYRELPPFGQKAMRRRAVELRREFAAPARPKVQRSENNAD